MLNPRIFRCFKTSPENIRHPRLDPQSLQPGTLAHNRQTFKDRRTVALAESRQAGAA
jgi:hypothetical protein